ncbi:hypothetical protein ACMHYB_45615 [Sorangium sp. So ce1128]
MLRDGKIYVISSRLNELIQTPPEQKARLRAEATSQRIGRAAR